MGTLHEDIWAFITSGWILLRTRFHTTKIV